MWPFKTKQYDFPELKEELLLLCREWFKGQIKDLPEDELPPKEEIERDIIQMRDETFERIISTVPTKKFLGNDNTPNDVENEKVFKGLVDAYAGHENTTPIFTILALSKVSELRYQSGWPLCTVRLVAETWLEQSVS